MYRQDRDDSKEMVKAILSESGMPESAQQLIKGMFQKQQETIIALEEIVRRNGSEISYVHRRLDELLVKVDPEEAEKRKNSTNCEAQAGIRLPSQGLI